MIFSFKKHALKNDIATIYTTIDLDPAEVVSTYNLNSASSVEECSPILQELHATDTEAEEIIEILAQEAQKIPPSEDKNDLSPDNQQEMPFKRTELPLKGEETYSEGNSPEEEENALEWPKNKDSDGPDMFTLESLLMTLQPTERINIVNLRDNKVVASGMVKEEIEFEEYLDAYVFGISKDKDWGALWIAVDKLEY